MEREGGREKGGKEDVVAGRGDIMKFKLTALGQSAMCPFPCLCTFHFAHSCFHPNPTWVRKVLEEGE